MATQTAGQSAIATARANLATTLDTLTATAASIRSTVLGLKPVSNVMTAIRAFAAPVAAAPAAAPAPYEAPRDTDYESWG